MIQKLEPVYTMQLIAPFKSTAVEVGVQHRIYPQAEKTLITRTCFRSQLKE